MVLFNLKTDYIENDTRRKCGLVGKKLIGRGWFSAIYDNGDTVLKLTACEKSYHLLRDPFAPKSKHLPVLVNDFGEVGQVDGLSLYLLEIEKLVKIKAHSSERVLSKRICQTLKTEKRSQHEKSERRLGDGEASVLALGGLAMKRWLPKKMRDLVGDIQTFCRDYDDCTPDFHSANFMIRPKDGTFVFSDPVATESLR